MRDLIAGYRIVALCALSAACLLALSVAVSARAAESLDPSFGEGGISLPRIGSGDIRGLTQDTKGRLLSGGTLHGAFLLVARYGRNGTRDESFGDEGRVIADAGFDSRVNALSVQSDGKIVVAGASGAGTFVLDRFREGGARDLTFGERGRTVTTAGFHGGGAQDLEVQQSGRILATGYGIDIKRRWKAMVTAYRPNGAPDRRFGRRGVLTLRPTAREAPIELVALEVLPSDRILAAGTLNGRVMLLRLRADGELDRSFGGDGLVFLDVDRDPECACTYTTDMQVDRRGRILIAANVTGPREREPAALIRYRPDGTLDKTFGKQGVAPALLGSRLASKAMALQKDGRIVLAGTYNVPRSGEARVAAVRFLPDGRIDHSFARRGFFTRDFGYEGVAYAALTQRDGKVVIAGRANSRPSDFPENPSVYDTASVFLVRFLP